VLSASVGDVCKPPVITVAAACCNVVNCLVTLAEPIPFAPGWFPCMGAH